MILLRRDSHVRCTLGIVPQTLLNRSWRVPLGFEVAGEETRTFLLVQTMSTTPAHSNRAGVSRRIQVELAVEILRACGGSGASDQQVLAFLQSASVNKSPSVEVHSR